MLCESSGNEVNVLLLRFHGHGPMREPAVLPKLSNHLLGNWATEWAVRLLFFSQNDLTRVPGSLQRSVTRSSQRIIVVLIILVAGAPRFFVRFEWNIHGSSTLGSRLKQFYGVWKLMPHPQSRPISILSEEPHFLLVDKPAGLFSQAAPGVDSLETLLAKQLKQRDAHPGQPFIGLPHRLDRGTSGVMLVARNQRALKRFGQQFQSRKIGKFYLAVVQGDVSGLPQRWEDHLRKVPAQPVAEIVTAEAEGARKAQLDVLAVAQHAHQSLLLVRLHTGRMHQIRIQAAHRGYPVLGDATYGSTDSFPIATSADETQAEGFALHALRLEFRHPQNGKQRSGTAPVPQAWQTLPEKLQDAAQSLLSKSQDEGDTPWRLSDLANVP